jgi:hypothetical protein
LHWSAPSRACGAAYPPGAFARLAAERAVLVWDAESRTEHFIRMPVFEGDPTSFGFFVPTPTLPVVARADEATFDRVAALVPALAQGNGGGAAPAAAPGGGRVEVLQRVTIEGFELVSLKASSSDELGGWLGANGFVDRPELRRWTQRYLSKGWIVNAMKYAGSKDRAPRAIETPALRFSFKAERPFHPYTEPEPSVTDERAYAARAPRGPSQRSVDLWVVAREPVSAFQGADARGPRRVGSASVPQAALAAALGDTRSWGFEPRGTWTVTHFHDESIVRTAFDDLTFASSAQGAAVSGEDAAEDAQDGRSRVLLLVLALSSALGVAFALRDGAHAR